MPPIAVPRRRNHLNHCARPGLDPAFGPRLAAQSETATVGEVISGNTAQTLYESQVTYDRTTGAGSTGAGFADLVPGTAPAGNVRAYDPDLRPQFTQQWNVFAEYQLTNSMSGQVGYACTRPATRCRSAATGPEGANGTR
jgi:hypothetical protein